MGRAPEGMVWKRKHANGDRTNFTRKNLVAMPQGRALRGRTLRYVGVSMQGRKYTAKIGIPGGASRSTWATSRPSKKPPALTTRPWSSRAANPSTSPTHLSRRPRAWGWGHPRRTSEWPARSPRGRSPPAGGLEQGILGTLGVDRQGRDVGAPQVVGHPLKSWAAWWTQ